MKALSIEKDLIRIQRSFFVGVQKISFLPPVTKVGFQSEYLMGARLRLESDEDYII